MNARKNGGTMRAKYVMTDKGPILFPESFKHEEFKGFKPSSAGFVLIDLIAYTFGASGSLRMVPDPGDQLSIEKAFDIKPFERG